ncbi:hypothetical protein [Ideonella sp. BN130291]|uniref:hypothetical protein n=1 Tax=Ideonella sp. BN130291 TaxID=3112940 RepID=UPI002E26A46A|nr:hypothetical protein [Ideonella sp. BN130291]
MGSRAAKMLWPFGLSAVGLFIGLLYRWGWDKFVDNATGATAAAWFQGVFSLAAVIVALKLAHDANQQQTKNADQLACTYVDALLESLFALKISLWAEAEDVLEIAEHKMEEVLDVGRAVPLQHLDPKMASAMVNLRGFNNAIIERIQRRPLNGPEDWAEWHDFAEFAIGSVRRINRAGRGLPEPRSSEPSPGTGSQ